MGRSKMKEAEVKTKIVYDSLRDPLVDVCKKVRWYSSNSSYSCTWKMWKSPSKRCSTSQTQHSPWLILHDNSRRPDTLSRGWSRYCWSLHASPFGYCQQGQYVISKFGRIETCKNEDLHWTKEECTVEDPNSSQAQSPIEFTNAIVYKEKLYLLSLQGTLATLDTNSHPRLSILNIQRAIPSAVSKGYREHLIEFFGQLLIVFLICKKSMDIVDDVEVYQLDLLELSWTKVASLGYSSLFVSTDSCMHICPTKPRRKRERIYLTGCDADDWWSNQGYRKNCIYFTNGKTDELWVFRMEDGSISLTSRMPSN